MYGATQAGSPVASPERSARRDPGPDLPIYLDHAATTPVAPEVVEAMLPYLAERYGNPAALYSVAAEAREAVDRARAVVAAAIGADPEEVYFTSGGTEADNWAVKGLHAVRTGAGTCHVLTTAIEHHAVLDSCLGLRRLGCEVELVPVDGKCLVEPDEFGKRIRRETRYISVMHANNEVGTIQPIEEISEICRHYEVRLHCDAVQTFGKLPIDVNRLGVDLLTMSAHKLYGPKGVGALYIRRGTRIAPLLEGGGQERGRRAGTVNVPGVVGFARAVELALERRVGEEERLRTLRDRLIDGVEAAVSGAKLMGDRTARLANNVHFCVDGVEGETMLLALDALGICASAGSACTTGSVEPSHVLLAMGVPVARARGALRLTLGAGTTAEAVDYTVPRLAEVVGELRALS